MSTTKIATHTCLHADQDRRYGSGQRVWNAGKLASNGERIWRCTVCGEERTAKDKQED